MLLTACSGFVSRFIRFCVDVLDMAVIGGMWVAEEEAFKMFGAMFVD